MERGASPSLTEDQKVLAATENLGIRRDGRWLVRHIDLEVRRGEIVTLIGPNGGGKTTTVKALLGMIRPDEGRVMRSAGVSIGYLPQRLAVDATLPLTVRRLMTLTRAFSAAEIDAALDAVDIRHLGGAAVQSLSGGEFQRALLARAIIRRPDLLVLDEPVQGVDFAGELKLYELIARIRDELGCGVLLISHDLHIVMARTDTVICIEGGIACRGTPHAVAESVEYRRLFGAPAAAMLAVYAHPDHHNTDDADGHGQAGHDHGRDDGHAHVR